MQEPKLLQGGTLFLMESGVRTGASVSGQTSAHSQIITPPPVSTQENLLVSLEGLGGSLSPSPALRDMTWLRLPILHPKGVAAEEGEP